MENQETTRQGAASIPPYAAGTGSAPLNADRAAFAGMSYRERLALKRADPQTYEAMRKQ